MADYLKVKGTEIDLTTANTVASSVLVRIYASTPALITVANTAGTIGTFTVGSNSVEYVIKEPTDTLAANNAVKATSVSYK